jgi:hypothetical protein
MSILCAGLKQTIPIQRRVNFRELFIADCVIAMDSKRAPVRGRSGGHRGLKLRAALLAQVVNQGRIIPNRRFPLFQSDELGEIYFVHVAGFGLR